MPRVLLIDDDEALAAPLATYLKRFDLELEAAHRPSAGFARLAAGGIDAVILDVMLPEMDGFEVCRRLRADPATAAVPVLMLTAKGEDTDRIAGLDLGADDYLPKPFEPRELLLRLQIILRRNQSVQSQPVAPQIIRLGRFHYQSGSDALKADDASIRLGSVEVKLLQALLAAPHHSLSRDELANLLELDLAALDDRL